jgi:Icc-related predicted phosphoesterase
MEGKMIKKSFYVIIILGLILALSGCTEKPQNNPIEKPMDIEKSNIGPINNDNSNQISFDDGSSSHHLKFIIVGDPHVKTTNGPNRGNERLIQVVNYIDNSDADFAVFLGDIADDGKNKTFNIAKKILSNMTKPYYVIAGNHDILVSPNNFEHYFGPMEHIENIKGYQLLFVGIRNETNTVNPKEHGQVILHWSFDFNKANKTLPTLVFLHGPTKGPPPECDGCNWEQFFGYAKSMQPELDKFTNLVGVMSGHVHYDSFQQFGNTSYITVNGLIETNAGGIHAFPSDGVGYVNITNGKLDYGLISYNINNSSQINNGVIQ